LAKTEGLGFQHNQFVVGVPNTFVAEYLNRNQRSLIEKTLINLTHQEIQVQFQVANGHPTAASPTRPEPEYPGDRSSPGVRFNPRYTFDTFVVGNSNRFAHAAALGVAENLGRGYNPLFIYGGAGLGKTHLLHAAGQVALASSMKTLYVTAEQYTNEFVHSIRYQKTDEFHSRYRSADMLFIDDIQFISGKEQTEESLFHTFNTLHNANRQIVVTSDRPPKNLSLLEERLRSRFQWGLVADIQPPDFETRLAILQSKADSDGIRIDGDVLEYIAQHIQLNIRELEGSLNRIVAYAKLIRTLLTPQLAAQVIDGMNPQQPPTTGPTAATIIETVASSFQVLPLDLKSKKRDRETAMARQVAMYLLKQATNYSMAQIGQELGGRDHSSVSHACRKIANTADSNAYLRRKLREIQRQVSPDL